MKNIKKLTWHVGYAFVVVLLYGLPAQGSTLSREVWGDDDTANSYTGWDYENYQGGYSGPYKDYAWYYDYYGYPYGPYHSGPGKTDMELLRDVKSQLTWSPFVDADHIYVRVENGTVYLRGSVEDESELQDAIDNAHEAGAKKVVNRLAIRDE